MKEMAQRTFGMAAMALALGLMIVGAPVAAETRRPGPPTSLCGALSCVPAFADIWTRFQRGGSPRQETVAALYAGECFVRQPGLDPGRAHHVGFVLDPTGPGRTELRLQFSFFALEPPYDGLSVADARGRFPGPTVPISFAETYAYADVTDDPVFFSRYWLREDPRSDALLLVSYFGLTATILCDAWPVG